LPLWLRGLALLARLPRLWLPRLWLPRMPRMRRMPMLTAPIS